MDKTILSAYTALTVADLLLCILAITILVKCYKEKSFNGTFKLSLGVALWSGFQFIDRAWWTWWKSNYISRRPSQWMIDHELALLCPLIMTAGILLVILSLTECSPYKRAFSLSLGAIIGAGAIAWIIK